MSAFWIIVPVKDTTQSKQRLGELLLPEQRRQLAHVMLEDVLEAIAPLRDRAPCVLVTIDDFARSLADRYGMRTIADGAHDGHTGAVDGGRRRVAGEGAEGMLTMPGDIPLVNTKEIAQVLDAHHRSNGFTIVPAGDEKGSNAVCCSPPLAVPLRFGEDSFFPHLDASRRVGIEPVIKKLSGIATDVDTPVDVERLLRRDPTGRSRAVRLLYSFGFTSDSTPDRSDDLANTEINVETVE